MKTVIITGANSGLGFETARKVARNADFRVVLACRNREKAEAAKEKIISETGNRNVAVGMLDTSSLASVRAFADSIIKSGESIYALVNNAGITAMGNSGTTDEGFELVFATNYLGHFLLTNLLLPHMEAGGKIINVSSDMHNPPGGLTWPGAEALAHPTKDDHRKYSYTKLCMIYFTHELSIRLAREGNDVTTNAFNPGFMADTNFAKGGGKMRELMVKTTMPDRYGKLDTSSDALSQLVADEGLPGTSGAYFDRSIRTARSSELSYDEANAAELWRRSEEYTGLSVI